MAEGGANENHRLDIHSFGSGFIFCCDVCEGGDIYLEAEGFCVDCCEYLCEFCFASHQRTRQTLRHKLLSKDNMPKDTHSSARVSKAITTQCTSHAGKLVKYYCKTHDVLGCNRCYVTSHTSCSGVKSILKESENIPNSKEYTEFIITLESIKNKAHGNMAKAHVNIILTKNCHSEVVESVKLLKKIVNGFSDQLAKEIVTVADTIVSEEKRKMTDISNSCSTAAESLQTILGDFDNLRSSRRVCQVYIAMKERSDHINALQDKIRKAEEDLVVRTFKLELNTNRAFQQDTGEAPCVVLRITERQPPNYPVCGEIMHVEDMCNLDTGIFKRFAIACAMLSNTRLVIVFGFEGTVAVADTQTNMLLSDLFVDDFPDDVTVISKERLGVTVSGYPGILFLNVSDTGQLELDRKICFKDVGRAVAYSKNRLVVAFVYPIRLEIMDLSGKVRKTILENGGNELFTIPNNVCVSEDGETIYTSDWCNNRVASFTFDGVFKSVYKDQELIGPQRVCADHHGNVYVGCRESKNVHMLTADLVKIRIILTQEDSLNNNLSFLSHCQETNSLYVGMGKKVKMFQL